MLNSTCSTTLNDNYKILNLFTDVKPKTFGYSFVHTFNFALGDHRTIYMAQLNSKKFRKISPKNVEILHANRKTDNAPSYPINPNNFHPLVR